MKVPTPENIKLFIACASCAMLALAIMWNSKKWIDLLAKVILACLTAWGASIWMRI